MKNMPVKKSLDDGKVSLSLAVKADSRYRFDRLKVRKGVLKLLGEQGVRGKVELSLSIVGDRKIKELKKKYLGIDEVTDVLSFPLVEGEPIPGEEKVISLGDVVVCYPQAKRQALRRNKLIDDEIEFLVCHGVLHLLGIHHN